jgi:hypothetical protein
MNNLAIAAAIIVSVVLSACATRSDIVSAGVRDKFPSSLPALKLAACIDRNIDENSALGSLHSKVIDSGVQPIEVVVLNGATTYAVVQVTSVEGGSSASFYYGGVANMFPGEAFRTMTKGCQ